MTQSRMLKISRLEGLTDGVFAIAMTILILDVRVPLILPPHELSSILWGTISLKLGIYIGSFIILGTLWVAMNFQLGLLERLNRPYLWCNVFYLMVICVVPFSASLLGAYPREPASVSFYAINLLCCGLGQAITLQCAHIFKLNKDIYTPTIRRAVLKRLSFAPPFYIAALFLAHWNVTLAFVLLIVPTVVYILPGRVDKLESSL